MDKEQQWQDKAEFYRTWGEEFRVGWQLGFYCIEVCKRGRERGRAPKIKLMCRAEAWIHGDETGKGNRDVFPSARSPEPQHPASPTDKASLCHSSGWGQSRLLLKLYSTHFQFICLTVKYWQPVLNGSFLAQVTDTTCFLTHLHFSFAFCFFKSN